MEESPKSARRSHETDKHEGNVLEMVSTHSPHDDAEQQKLTDGTAARVPERHEKVVDDNRLQTTY